MILHFVMRNRAIANIINMQLTYCDICRSSIMNGDLLIFEFYYFSFCIGYISFTIERKKRLFIVKFVNCHVSFFFYAVFNCFHIVKTQSVILAFFFISIAKIPKNNSKTSIAIWPGGSVAAF